MSLPISKMWVFASDSNPNKKYQTLQYTDGSLSCNCMGWTRRCTADGERSCKHTRSVDANVADSECVNSVDYPENKIKVTKTVSKPKAKAFDEDFETPQKRKIQW